MRENEQCSKKNARAHCYSIFLLFLFFSISFFPPYSERMGRKFYNKIEKLVARISLDVEQERKEELFERTSGARLNI